MHVLIGSTDESLAASIAAALDAECHGHERVVTGEDAIDLIKHYDFDIAVLDMDLPDANGAEVSRRLRAAKVRTPALLIGDAEISTKIAGLGAGADDYLTKPIDVSELLARMCAIVRRSRGHPASIIKTGRMSANLESRAFEIDGRPLSLTDKERSILALLSLRKGTTVTKEMLLDHLYFGIDEPELKIIDVFVVKLRKKIEVV